MLSIDDVIRTFIEGWEEMFQSHNSNPIRFVLDAALDSDEKNLEFAQGSELYNALDHMTLNSMQSISGMSYIEGEDIFRNFKPERPGRINYSTRTTDENLIVDISDNGPGIEEKVLDRIFEYGASTKGTRGSGLKDSLEGIKYLGGNLYLLETCNEGATFRIEMPRSLY